MTQNCLAWLNEVGIIVAMFGGIIIFFRGLPQPPFQGPRVQWDNDENRAAEHEAAKQKLSYQRHAWIGFWIIMAGFALQAFANLPIFK